MDDRVERIRGDLLACVEAGPGLHPDAIERVGRLLYGRELSGLGPEVDLWRGRTMTHFRAYFSSAAGHRALPSTKGRLLQAIQRLVYALWMASDDRLPDSSRANESRDTLRYVSAGRSTGDGKPRWLTAFGNC